MPEAPDRPAAGPAALCVVIPTLDEEASIGELVESLLRGPAPQERADRVVVADGGSSDATCKRARAAGATVVPAGRGRGTQLAAGAAACARSGASAEAARAPAPATDLLLFLHADSRLAPPALAAIRRAFGDPGLGFAGLTQRVDAPGRFYRWIEAAANRRVGRGMVFGDSGLVCRRELYERVGGFEAVPLFEDVDLSRRLARQARWTRVRDAELLISARRWQAEGALRTTLRNWMLRMAYALGVGPERLAGFYAAHGRSQEESQ